MLYAAVRAVLVAFAKVFWRLRIDGLEHVPTEGAFVLAPVHRSNVDTPLVAGVTRRRLRYMGKDTMWKIGPIGKLFTALGAFPVHRGTVDREALRRTVEVLQSGEPVVIFPEGTRQSGPLVQPLFEGAAYVAAKVGVPIVPVGIGGSEQAMPKGSKLLRPVKVHIVVGEPIAPPRARRPQAGRARDDRTAPVPPARAVRHGPGPRRPLETPHFHRHSPCGNADSVVGVRTSWGGRTPRGRWARSARGARWGSRGRSWSGPTRRRTARPASYQSLPWYCSRALGSPPKWA